MAVKCWPYKYGKHASKKLCVFSETDWFKEGWEDVDNDTRNGQTKAQRNRYKYWQEWIQCVQIKLANDSIKLNTWEESSARILTKDLEKEKIFSKMVPWILTYVQMLASGFIWSAK